MKSLNKIVLFINYLWRVIATGFCFMLFGLFGLLLSLLYFPLLNFLIRNEKTRKQLARKTVKSMFRTFVGLIALTRVFKFSLQDVETLKGLKGQLILSNHPTLIDVVVLISIIPNTDCVVKAHLFKNPFIRGVITNTGYINNDDPERLLKDCKLSLAEGNNLILFPEGTRTNPDEPLSFQRGAANIAIRCKAKITSLLIKVEPATLRKHENWYQIPPRKAHFELKFTKKSIQVPELDLGKEAKQARVFSRYLEDFFMQELKSL